MTVRHVPIRDWDLKLGHRILSSIKSNGFISAMTKGERGYGKTAYDIKNMAYIGYHVNGYTSDDDAYRFALQNIIFTPEELLDKVDKNISNNECSSVWTIDDASVHFSSYMFFINVYMTALMNSTFDTIRTYTHGLLLNCPMKKRLLRSLQTYDDYEITIYKEEPGGYERKAVAIKWYSLPDGHRRYRKGFEDYFSCYIPDWVYDEYMKERVRHFNEINKELRVIRDKLNKRKEEAFMTIEREEDDAEP